MINLNFLFNTHAQSIITRNDVNIPDGGVDLASILSYVFTLAGAIAVIVVAVAGFQYVVSSGDPASTAKAKNAIIYAVIGLAVCIAAFTIVNFVGSRI